VWKKVKQEQCSLVVHCFGGKGRAGTFFAALLMVSDPTLSCWDAIRLVRQFRKGALQNRLQRFYLWNFDHYRRSKGV